MQSAPARGRRGLAVVAAVLALTAISVSLPAPTHASTESTMETSLKLWINRDRLARGLHRLRNDTRLEVLAGDRASWMASKGSLTHTSADGGPCDAMTKRSIYWYRCGEDIGYTTATWGKGSAKYIYNLWRHSAGHWALLMSSRFNYLGIGVARRSNGATYASIVFLEGPDRTAPTAKMHSRTVQWSGSQVDLDGRGRQAPDPYRRAQELQRRAAHRQRRVRPDPDEHHEDVVEPAPPGAWPLVLGPGPGQGQTGQPVRLVAWDACLAPLTDRS